MERLTEDQRQDRRRIIDISYRHKLSHLGSNLTAVDGISAIYGVKNRNERFVLSEGHAGLAQYVVMERHGLGDAEEMLEKQGIHPDRMDDPRMDCSTGSLGQGLPIALGMALADRYKTVWAMISDGECAEGSIWEALRIASDQEVSNLRVILNANGYGAYDEVNTKQLVRRVRAFGWQTISVDGHNPLWLAEALTYNMDPEYLQDITPPTMVIARTRVNQLPFLQGLSAHYMTMNEEQYKQAREIYR